MPRRILSSTPSGENGEDVDRRGALIREYEEKRQILRDQNRKILHPPPIEGIDIGVMEGLEMLDPEIRIPTDEDFVLPPPLESLLDKAKTAYKCLPKQGDIDRLIAKINKKVLRDTNLCVDLRDLKVAYLTSPHFRDIYLYLLQNRIPLGKGAAKQFDPTFLTYRLSLTTLGCGIPSPIVRKAIEDNDPSDDDISLDDCVAQALTVWWLSSNKPSIWKSDRIR